MNFTTKIKSPFTIRELVRRQIWNCVWVLFFRPSPRIAFGWRRMLLILFGAKIAPSARIHNSTKIWAPWNLVMKSRSAMAEHVDCYNVGLVTLEEAAIASQYAYLCTASHAIDDPGFPLVTAPIRLERMSWVAAKAIVGMGVVVGEGGVVALGALALKSVEPWTVVGGVPAKLIKKRQRF